MFWFMLGCLGLSDFPDLDADGFFADVDCDDLDAQVNPDGTERCNGADDDCDGLIDEAGTSGESTFYADVDGDGFGADRGAAVACEIPSGYSTVAGDCDDAVAAVNPGAPESCTTAYDDNCDDVTNDEDSASCMPFYADVDLDGYGSGTSACLCEATAAFPVTLPGDCDDGDSTANPAGTEVCDLADADEDCDGLADDADGSVTGTTAYFADADTDGYGDDTDAVSACDAPAGYAASGGDCDDADSAYHPGAGESNCADPADYNCDGSTGYSDTDGDGFAACEECNDGDVTVSPDGFEMCDGVDNDCDGEIDEDTSLDATTWYVDADSDGFGGSATTSACTVPSGYVAVAGDCDDGSNTVNPAGTEVCDGADVDEDCSGTADEENSASCTAFYADSDLDGYGFGTSACLCGATAEFPTTVGGDCDDLDDTANPAGIEVCDEGDVDEDCDGVVDDADGSVAGTATYYLDADLDGYGEDAATVWACDQPSGYAVLAGDCDDAAEDYNPGADESDCADPNDYNCDGATGYIDGDGDGYAACEECNDTDGAVSPIGVEFCDGVDNDCDGEVDEASASDAATWYIDRDSDGFGGDDSVLACTIPSGYAAVAGDCDDTSAVENPGEVEVCDLADVDEDCSGVANDEGSASCTAFYADSDFDGYGFGTSACLCNATAEFPTSVDGDCDDLDGTANPAGIEVCDVADIDEDCDGWVDDADDSVAGTNTYYWDADVDGYGEDADFVSACDAPDGYATLGGDCDDSDEDYNPGVDESDCTDPNDYNCDGATGYVDGDGDGYAACEECNDADEAVSPVGVELCDTIDNDCNGVVDDDWALDAATWFVDGDLDGFGGDHTVMACVIPSGYAGVAGDCDDANAGENPGEVEVCDPSDVDEDCSGMADDTGASPASMTTYYADSDNDGFGGSTTTAACSAPSGYLSTSTDCDDADGDTFPGAAGSDSLTACMKDGDLDEYGDLAPSSGVAAGTDCDDGDSLVHPGTTDVVDNVDSDCDGLDAECGVLTLLVPGEYSSIQEAIDAACDGDVVNVAAGTYVENIDFDGKDITVQGAGADYTTIDGDYNGTSVVTMDAGTLEGFTVTNGLALTGGGIYASGGDVLELVDLVVAENTAAGSGGGIYVSGIANVVMTDVEISENDAGSSGGGMYVSVSSGGSLVESGLVVMGNAVSDWGGGVYATGTVDLSGAVVSGNYSSAHGGGVVASGSVDLSGGCGFSIERTDVLSRDDKCVLI